MGQALKKVYSLASYELKSFNVERRAQKVISQDKPIPAPKHQSTIKELERLKKENVSTDYLQKKDEQLDEYLKKVYVTSENPAPPSGRVVNPERPLPQNRATYVGGIDYGYSESEEATIPEGKVSLRQALEFIDSHKKDPKKHSSTAIASQYKMSLSVTNDILEHFKMFSVRVHKKKIDPESLSSYEKLQLKIKNMTVHNAPETVEEIKELLKEPTDQKSVTESKNDNISKKEIIESSNATTEEGGGKDSSKKQENG